MKEKEDEKKTTNMREQRERENITTQRNLQPFLSTKLHASTSKAAYLRACGLLWRTDLMISRTKVKLELHGDSNTRADIITLNMTCAAFNQVTAG